jgi:hypothetical protein
MGMFDDPPWSLVDAIGWRQRYLQMDGVSPQEAFSELRRLCLGTRVRAIGNRAADHPFGASYQLLPEGYRPFVDPPPPLVPEEIPSWEWASLVYEHGQNRLFWTTTGFLAWFDVKFQEGRKLAIAWRDSWLKTSKQKGGAPPTRNRPGPKPALTGNELSRTDAG